MPDSKGKNLPPLSEEALNQGYKESTELKFVKCPHSNTTLFSSTELRCTCGDNWYGPDVRQLQRLFNRG